jgi:predicted ATPase/class 3 adenylate cyclase
MLSEVTKPSPRPLPLGTVTFMLTDIEGSTRMWRERPTAMFQAVRRHRELIHRMVVRYGGSLPRDQGEGDSVFAVFERVTDGVAAAVDIQRAFRTEPWPEGITLRTRVALHSGEAELRDGNYYGFAVSRTARIRSLAWGEQILLSEAAYLLVRDSLPTGTAVRDLGPHTLKDFDHPERVYQVLHPELPAKFASLQARDVAPNNLPVLLTTFVGRKTEIVAVRTLLETARLVTLTGTGGSGKTRLAIEVAKESLGNYESGVHLVDLASVTDPSLVPSTMAQSLGVHERPGDTTFESLVQFLEDKTMLLVLDNFERVTDAASTVSELLAACPSVSVLATSRSPLRLSGEREYAVPPLRVPEAPRSAHEATDFEAIRLFVERAQASSFSFSLTEDNVKVVTEICARLDGLPLAIELAAAHVKLLPLPALRDRLANRLDLLKGGARDLPERQQTLRNLIDWDYELLPENERTLFRRLAVFAGGFTFEEAEAVVGPIEGVDLLDGLEDLVEKSLLRHKMSKWDEARFWMLQTIRDYGLEALDAAGEGEHTRRRHAAFFRAFANRADGELRGPDQVQWLARLDAEHDNIREALRWAHEFEEPEFELEMAADLTMFWATRGHLTEGWRWVEPAMERSTSVVSLDRARLLTGAATLMRARNDYDQARRILEDALELYRRLEDDDGVASTLKDMANLWFDEGDLGLARELYGRSLEIWRRQGNTLGVAGALNNLGVTEHIEGRPAEALEYLAESLDVFQKIGDKQGIARVLMNQGGALRDLGELEKAARLLMDSLLLWRELGDKWDATDCLEDLGAVYLEQGRYATSATVYGAAEALRTEIGAPRAPYDDKTYNQRMERLRQELGGELGAAWGRGRAMKMGQAVDFALGTRETGPREVSGMHGRPKLN